MSDWPESEWIKDDLEKLRKYRSRVDTLGWQILLLEADADGLRKTRIEELRKEQAKCRAYVEYYDRLLALLPEDERLALEILMIDDGKNRIDRAKDALHREKSTLYRLKDRALLQLANLVTESQDSM